MKMTAHFLLIFSFIFTLSISLADLKAQESTEIKSKIYLLISFIEESEHKFHNRIKKLQKKLHRELEGYGELITMKNVSAFDLHKIVTDKTTKSIFWISHGGAATFYGVQKNIIKDYLGNTVQDIFNLAHKKIEFMGIISCNSSYAIKSNEDRNLPLWVSEKKVSPYSGLKKSLSAYKKTYLNSMNEIPEQQDNYQFSIIRVSSEKSYKGPLRIRVNGKTVGYNINNPQNTYQLIKISQNIGPVEKVQLIVDKEYSKDFYRSKGNGKVQIKNIKSSWMPLTKKDGTILQGVIQTYKRR